MAPSQKQHDDIDIIDDQMDEADETQSEEEEEYLVEAILDKRKSNGKTEYLVKWENYDHSQNTWEPTDNLNCASLIAAYEENEANKRKNRLRNSTSKRASRNSSVTGSVLSSRDGESSRRNLDTSDTEEDEVEVSRKRKSRGQLEMVPERAENIMPAREPPKSFARNLDLDSIISGMFDEHERMYFMVRWKSRGVEMIPIEELEEKAPRELCAFYRHRLYQTISAPHDKYVLELFKQSSDTIDD